MEELVSNLFRNITILPVNSSSGCVIKHIIENYEQIIDKKEAQALIRVLKNFISLVDSGYANVTEEQIARWNLRQIEDAIKEDPFQPQVKERDGFVYVVSYLNLYKIGKTTSLKGRMSAIFDTSTHPYTQHFNFEGAIHYGKDYSKMEAYWHHYFKNKRCEGEWFALDLDDIEYLRSLFTHYTY